MLLGGGHSHVEVLRSFGRRPVPGVRLTLVSRLPATPYSGMLPGLIAGHYSSDEAHIALGPLARFAGARLLVAEAAGLELAARQVQLVDQAPLPYDLLSIDIGSTPNMTVPGAADHAVAVKPIDGLLARWTRVRDRLADADVRQHLAVVGGGAGGVELLLAVQYAMRHARAARGRDPDGLEYHLYSATPTVLPTHSGRVQRIFARVLRERGVHVHPDARVVEVGEGRLRTAGGMVHPAEVILWTTQAGAAPWLAASGLATDEEGFVRVSTRLESVSHRGVFASGDVASMDNHRRPKSGVYAVRQGPPLARNLRRAVAGQPLTPWYPQRQALSLISTGDRCAVASRGAVAFEGAWVWRVKDWIDRRFMRRYGDLHR